jgi:hypothetical protein
MEEAMPMSVRLDPTLEARVEEEAKRRGVTKSRFVIDALERALGLKDPASLLRDIRSLTPMGIPGASEEVSKRVRAKLRAKHSD